MKIGWIADQANYQGGAELLSAELQAAAPAGIEIVRGAARDADAYVLMNIATYDARLIEQIEGKPVIKWISDAWAHGDDRLRDWILTNAALLIFLSPLHRETFGYEVAAREIILSPSSPVILPQQGERKGACWIGRMWEGKGIEAAAAWAKENGITLDFYGYGPQEELARALGNYGGALTANEVMATLAKYEQFVFLPDGIEPFGRTVAEAWAAGCELIINGNVGAGWWIENDPMGMMRGAEKFWQEVEKVVRGQESGVRGREIEGFFLADEARLLREYAERATGPIVEIGSYKGLSTSILAEGARKAGQIVYAIDPHVEYRDPHPGGASFGPRDNIDFLRNIAPWGDVIRVINLASHEVARMWDRAIGLLFIDGSHVYEDVKLDFEEWSKWVGKDGFVAMHDTTTIPDVKRALDEILASGEWDIVARADSTAILQRRLLQIEIAKSDLTETSPPAPLHMERGEGVIS